MRKLYAFLLTAILVVVSQMSQAQVSGYIFSQSSGTFTPISGGTVLGSTSTDDERFLDPAVPLGTTGTTGPGFPIGFNFTFNNIVFDRVGINANGWICFGQSSLTPSVDINSTSAYTPLSSTAANTPALLRNRVAVFGRDIQGQAGSEIRIQTIGSAPNRQFVIQWLGYKRFGTAGTGDNVNFQIILNETTNTVQLVYGSVVLNNTTTTSSIDHVGLGGTTSTDFINRQTAVPHNWNTTTAGATNAVGVQNPTSTIAVTAPTSGLTFTYTPVVPCSGVPSPGFITGPTSVLCSGSGGGTLTLNGYTTGNGINLQWKSSTTPGGPYTPIAGATNPTYTFTASVTTYYVCTVTCANSGFSGTSSEFTVTVDKPVHTSVTATPNTVCSPGATTIVGTVTGGVTTSGITVVGTSGTINLAVPDNTPAGVNSTINIPAGTSIPNAGSLKVRINMKHTWVGDLKFTLTTPCGTTLLFDRPGVPVSTVGNSDNLGTDNTTNPNPAVYTFDVAGATVIPETNVGTGFIAAGTYKPSDVNGAAQNWAGLTFPCTATGTWTLNISDNAGGDVGTLVDWQILAPGTGVYTHTLTGPGTIGAVANSGPNNSTGTFNVTNLPAGTHTFTFTSTDMIGCSVSSTVTVTVTQTPVITITPSAPVICAGAVQQLTANASPGVQTTFTATGLITIPGTGSGTATGAPANPYPSNLVVSGLPTTGLVVRNVTLNGIIHTFPADIDIVLQSPTGTNVILMSDAGGTSAFATPGRNYVLDDAAAALIASGSPSGTYKPTNIGTPDNWDPPGPGSLSQANPTLSSFTGNFNGTWKLFIVDDAGGDVGSISSWSITFEQPAPVTFTPITGLYTDAGATTSYVAGTPVNVVYAKPATTTTYTASATNGTCTGTANVTVTVNQLPAITVQPAALAAPACPGTKVVYTVTATGAGLTYQWQVSTNGGTSYTNLVNDAIYTGVTTNSLTAQVTTAMTNYLYRVIVSGTCTPAVTSNAVTLVVATTPTITTQPANVTVCAGTNAVFSVVAGGIPAPTGYQWQVSTNGGTTYTNLTTGGSYTNTLTITGTTTALTGNRYRVIINNSCGQTVTSNAVTLTVNGTTAAVATDLWTRRICVSDTLVPLVGTPVGGFWTGPGVSGFNFIPPATGVGTYTLTYSYTNTSGCTTTDTTKVIVSDCAERIRLLIKDAVIVFPNPSNGQFNIKMNSTLYNYLGMKILTPTGQLVKTQVFSGLVYGRVIPVDASFLPSGTYMVKLFYDDGIRTSEKTFPLIIVK